MNKAILVGRLTRDPDVQISQNDGKVIARYSLAVDRRGKKDGGGQDADFINIVAFDKNGEFAEKYLHKGMKILVEGHIHTGSYEKDGKKVYTTDVIVERHEFVESKREQSEFVQNGTVDGTGFVPSDGEAESVFNF